MALFVHLKKFFFLPRAAVQVSIAPEPWVSAAHFRAEPRPENPPKPTGSGWAGGASTAPLGAAACDMSPL